MKDDGLAPECVVTEIRMPLAAELRTHFLFFLVLSQSVSLSVALKLHGSLAGHDILCLNESKDDPIAVKSRTLSLPGQSRCEGAWVLDWLGTTRFSKT